MNHNLQTRIKFALQQIGIATAFLTTKSNSIYLFILSLMGLTAPFWHIFMSSYDTPGYFGYKYMSSFLYSIGNIIAVISLGLLMLFASSRLNEFSKTFKLIGRLAVIVGSFFMIQVVYPKTQLLQLFGVRYFHPYIYYTIMITLSVSSGMVLTLAQRAVIQIEKKLKDIIHVLLKGYYEDIPTMNIVKEDKEMDYIRFRVDLTDKIVELEQGK